MESRPTVGLGDASSADEVRVRLVGRVDGKEVGAVELQGAMEVGSAKDCALVLSAPTVSRHHLSLERRAGGVWVKDLDSKNGTRFQGSKIKEALIPVGAILLLGDAEVRVEAIHDRPVARLGPLVSEAPKMIHAIQQLAKVAATDVTVLLEAETGCGKEVTARVLHEQSLRAKGPFETVDCGALPENLAASELFGHIKGSFTGAERTRPGAFERASGGTLFLDEVGELPQDLQPLLLRALEARQIRRVGDEEYRAVDVRVIAATNRDLQQEVTAGRFRKDLLHRLAVVRVRLPPLRERREDLGALVRTILDTLGPRARGFSLSPDALREFSRHDWPGNVRELKNVIERALALGDTSETPEAPSTEADPQATIDYKAARERAMDSFEREFVTHILTTFDNNVSKAARESGIDRAYLHKLIKKHGLMIQRP